MLSVTSCLEESAMPDRASVALMEKLNSLPTGKQIVGVTLVLEITGAVVSTVMDKEDDFAD